MQIEVCVTSIWHYGFLLLVSFCSNFRKKNFGYFFRSFEKKIKKQKKNVRFCDKLQRFLRTDECLVAWATSDLRLRDAIFYLSQVLRNISTSQVYYLSKNLDLKFLVQSSRFFFFSQLCAKYNDPEQKNVKMMDLFPVFSFD